MNKLIRFYSEFVLLIAVIFFIFFKSPQNKWDRIINSDGKGYYAYLPAIFIYKDLKYDFIDKYENKYYPEDKSAYKEFRIKKDNYIVNKCFVGLAVLWLPFFLIAHLLSYIFGFATDGYSAIYQYFISFAAFFYLWLGTKILFKILRNYNLSIRISTFIVIAISLGTNLFYYAVFDQSLTHVYNFTIIALFIYFQQKYFSDFRYKWLLLSSLIFGIIIIIRPQNLFILILIPFIAGNFEKLATFFKNLLAKKNIFIYCLLILISIISIQLAFWYLQTGNLLVYSYGNETFNFKNPHIFEILFSYRKGWFLYTPIAFISFFSIISLYKTNKYQLLWILLFWFCLIYFLSSWWCWWYGCCFGLRAFIDFYVVIAIMLGLVFSEIKNKIFKILLISILSLLITINLIQVYQHKTYIIPDDNITKKIYWDKFLLLHHKAKVYIEDSSIVWCNSFFTDVKNDWKKIDYKTYNNLKPDSFFNEISNKNIYSIGLYTSVPYDTNYFTKIIVGADIWSSSNKTNTNLVVELKKNSKTYNYLCYNIDNYINKKKWERVELDFNFEKIHSKNDSVLIYYYNTDTSRYIRIDNIKVDLLLVKKSKDY